jgi:hypothetical protein
VATVYLVAPELVEKTNRDLLFRTSTEDPPREKNKHDQAINPAGRGLVMVAAGLAPTPCRCRDSGWVPNNRACSARDSGPMTSQTANKAPVVVVGSTGRCRL